MDKVRQYFGTPTYVSREQAWQEFTEQVGDPDLLSGVVDNPLPASIRVRLKPELLSYGPMEQAAKQVLEMHRTLYSEGLVQPDIFTLEQEGVPTLASGQHSYMVVHEYDVTNLIHQDAANALAILVTPPAHGCTDLSFCTVDWNPEAPDMNAGLWGATQLDTTGPVPVHLEFRRHRICFRRYS